MPNTQMKDGLGNEFTLITRDQSLDASNSLRQNWHFDTKLPLDHTGGGSFQAVAKSNTIGAGLPVNSPIAMFRFASASNIAIVRRLRLNAWTIGAGFAAGVAQFDAFVARSFSSEDTGGLLASISSNTAKLRTSNMNAAVAHLRVSDTAALGVGTRTLDGQPFETAVAAPAPTTVNTAIVTNAVLLLEHDHPLVLENLEGVIVQASVPATGTWGFSIHVAWDEINSKQY
jgi:hypothetical protein